MYILQVALQQKIVLISIKTLLRACVCLYFRSKAESVIMIPSPSFINSTTSNLSIKLLNLHKYKQTINELFPINP